MESNQIPVVNVGEVVRHGLRLKTVEAVALVHAVCVQLDAATAVALPTSPDNLSVTDVGTVQVVHNTGEPQPVRLAVAILLERLLRAVTDEPGAVPPALRTLPARLRAAGTEQKKSDIKDLLSILAWHLPGGSREVLKDLFIRSKLSASATNGVADAGLVAPLLPGPDVDLHLQAPKQPATVVAMPTRPVAAPAVTKPAPVQPRRSSAWKYAAAAALAFAVAGYSGYRYTESRVGSDDATAAVETQPADSPRVVVVPRTEPDAAPSEGALAPAPASAPTAGVAAVTPATPTSRREPIEARPVNLAVRGGAFSPSFINAEPRRLLFHAGRDSTGRLFTATLDDRGSASALTPLFDETARNYHARPSPDGQWIAFDSDREGERAVFVADRNGKQIRRVSGEGFAAVPSWSPDMRTLAFVRAEPNRRQVWNLWMRDLATGQLSRATRFASGQSWGASWFADSASYAYSHEDRLVIANRGGQELAAFKSPIRGRLVRTPAVSPDGREIVFQVYRDGAWIVDVKTGAMRRILDDVTAEEFTWSPDGSQIAYHSRRDGEWRIWVMTP